MGWWDFAEGSGQVGKTLDISKVVCAFCEAEGNFNLVQGHKRTNQSGKPLHYELFQCINCGNYTFIFWSTAERNVRAVRYSSYDYLQLPYPIKSTKAPDYLPSDIARFWVQAGRSIDGGNWDAAALMARSAIQLVARKNEAKGKNLKEEIESLADKGLLPPIMREWAHEVRELGNSSAHPHIDTPEVKPEDARSVVDFMKFLCRVVYEIPEQINRYRDSRRPENGGEKD